MAISKINFDVEIRIEQREDGVYAATIMPFHVTGRSFTADMAIDRAKQGLDILLDQYGLAGTLQEFLDFGGIEYTLTEGSDPRSGDVSLVRERVAYAVSSLT